MKTTLSILCSKGDQKLVWDHSDPEAVAQVRETIAALAAAGYQFYLLDGSPADTAAAGAGQLIVRKLTAAELTEATTEPRGTDAAGEEPAAESEPPTVAEGTQPKRRGRPPKTRPPAEAPDVQAVAVRPMRGGCR